MRVPVAALLILSAISATFAAEDKPAAKKPLPPVVLELKGISQLSAGYANLEFKATNPRGQAFHYLGYTADPKAKPEKVQRIMPLHRFEVQQDGKWVALPQGWCGVGIGPVNIPAKKSGTFAATIPLNEKTPWGAVRVGIAFYPTGNRGKEKLQVEWSKPISRESIDDALAKAADKATKAK